MMVYIVVGVLLAVYAGVASTRKGHEKYETGGVMLVAAVFGPFFLAVGCVLAAFAAVLHVVGAAAQRLAPVDRCRWCKNEIDPDCCWCGVGPEDHGVYDNHPFVPMGCDCGRVSKK